VEEIFSRLLVNFKLRHYRAAVPQGGNGVFGTFFVMPPGQGGTA
jgi:hypothetical protein